MSTTATPEAAQSPGAQDVHLADLLYAGSEKANADPPQEPATPESDQDQPTPEPASAPPPAEAKQEEPPKADEAKEEKEERGQAAANRRLGRKVQELESQISKLVEENKIYQAKLSGTYEEPAAPTPDQIKAQAEFEAKEKISRQEAYRLYGEDVVQAQIYADDSPYRDLVKADPSVHFKVMRSDLPALAAMRELRRHEFEQTYGDDPTKWEEKITEKLKPKLFKEFKDQASKPPTGQPVQTVTAARSASAKTEPREKSLSDLLYGGTKA
jgi:hypothetical protein